MREDAASASTLVIPARARRQPQHRHPGESRDPYRGWAIFQSMAHTDAWPCSNARYASRARTRSCMRYVSGGIASLNRRLPACTPAGVLGSCRPRSAPQHPSSRAKTHRAGSRPAPTRPYQSCVMRTHTRHPSSRAKARDPYRDLQELSATDVFPRRTPQPLPASSPSSGPSSSPAVCRCAPAGSDTPGCRACL